MDYKIDYLTLTIKPVTNTNFKAGEFERFLFEFLYLSKLKDDFTETYGGKYYDFSYSYRNITVKVPYSSNASEQGYCITMSGSGLSFYDEYRKKWDKSFTFKQFLTDFFSLSDLGFDCRCTRIDIAYDDISTEENANYLLDMKRLENALKKGEFVSLFNIKSINESIYSGNLNVRKLSRSNRNQNLGNTLNIGNRKSKVFLRFYDKLLEQKEKGIEVDESIKHWVRMEFEFKDKRAMSICDAFISLQNDELSRYFSRIVNKYICFIVVKENNRSNYSRCPQKRWWTRVVGTLEKSKLVSCEARKNQFESSKKWLERSVYPTLYAVLQCISVDELLISVRENAIERQKHNHTLVVKDFYNNVESETASGYEVHKYTCDNYKEVLAEFEKAKMKNSMRRTRGEALKCFETQMIDNWKTDELELNIDTYGKKIDDFVSLSILDYEYRKLLGWV